MKDTQSIDDSLFVDYNNITDSKRLQLQRSCQTADYPIFPEADPTDTRETIRIGFITDGEWSSSYHSQAGYITDGAITYAVDKINNNSEILPNHKLEVCEGLILCTYLVHWSWRSLGEVWGEEIVLFQLCGAHSFLSMHVFLS